MIVNLLFKLEMPFYLRYKEIMYEVVRYIVVYLFITTKLETKMQTKA